MAQTNVQAFSGDVAISSNLAVDTNTLFVDSVGNKVGIGTDVPATKLHLQGASGELFRFTDGTREIYGGCDSNDPFFGTRTNHALRIVTNGTERVRILNGGNVGIGTANPTNSLHVYKAAGEATSGLLIEKASGTAGTAAALLFGTSHPSETTNVGIAKAGIFFERTTPNGRGDLKFCVDNVDDTNNVGVSDAALKITNEGYIQPGQINTGFSGASGSLKGNYLFQAIYNAYRVGGYNGTLTQVFEKRIQVCRMGSLVSIQANIPMKLSSTTFDLQFTWAELGLDAQRSSPVTVMNQSYGGTWGNATSSATYLILPSTGHAGNGSVGYVGIKYLIDMGWISAY